MAFDYEDIQLILIKCIVNSRSEVIRPLPRKTHIQDACSTGEHADDLSMTRLQNF